MSQSSSIPGPRGTRPVVAFTTFSNVPGPSGTRPVVRVANPSAKSAVGTGRRVLAAGRMGPATNAKCAHCRDFTRVMTRVDGRLQPADCPACSSASSIG